MSDKERLEFVGPDDRIHLRVKGKYKNKILGEVFLLNDKLVFYEEAQADASTKRRKKVIPYKDFNDYKLKKTEESCKLMVVQITKNGEKKETFQILDGTQGEPALKLLKERKRALQGHAATKDLAYDGKEVKTLAGKQQQTRDLTRDATEQRILAQQQEAAAASSSSSSQSSKSRALTTEERAILEPRAALLASDRDLKIAYMNLVGSNALSEEEFWASHGTALNGERQHLYAQPHSLPPQFVVVEDDGSTSMPSSTSSSSSSSHNEAISVIKLDDHWRKGILQTYPKVRAQHLRVVPDKLTEEEFWTRYLRAQFFRTQDGRKRKRRGAGKQTLVPTHTRLKDHVAPSASTGGEGSTRLAATITPSMDLRRQDDVRLDAEAKLVIDSEFKQSQQVIRDHEQRGIHAKTVDVKSQYERTVRRTNARSQRVLEFQASQTEQFQPKNKRKTADRATSRTVYEAETHAAMDLPDLHAEKKVKYNELAIGRNGESIPKSSSHRYGDPLDMPTVYEPLTNPELHIAKSIVDEVSHLCLVQSQQHRAVQPSDRLQHDVQQDDGSFVVFKPHNGDHVLIPKDFIQQLRQLDRTCTELLRHFWSCFPVINVESRKKITRIHGKLAEQYELLKQKKSQLHQSSEVETQELAALHDPLMKRLNVAFQYYEMYQQKERRQQKNLKKSRKA